MLSNSIQPMVTFLISTYNRRAVLLRTLQELREVDRRCGLITETIVVDNASTDGTAEAVHSAYPEVELIHLNRNRGACSKNVGLAKAGGELIVFLDDDSYPTMGSIRRMVDYFMAEPRLGAAVFQVTLPNGSQESSAYPSVVIGCGTGFRLKALRQVGGLPNDFFMQAEEYDLSLRLLNGNWLIHRFEDLHVRHMKTSDARIPTRTTRLDVRNNVMVITRNFPRRWVVPFMVDWVRRYWWMATTQGREHQMAAITGLAEGMVRSLLPGHRKPVGLAAFERFAMVVAIRRRMDQANRKHRLKTIVLIDVGKNLLPYFLAAQALGIHIMAIADSRLAARDRKYRGIPVLCDEDVMKMIFDAAIVANVSPTQSVNRTKFWRTSGREIIDLFEKTQTLRVAA